MINAFGYDEVSVQTKRGEPSSPQKNEKKQFRPNPFPYIWDTNENVNHDVMWYDPSVWKFGRKMTKRMEVRINRDIMRVLHDRLNKFEFDYIWVINPCPSVPDIFHVHVFSLNCVV